MRLILFIILSVFVCLSLSAQTNKTFKDERDGQTYPIIKINNKYWMAANLNFKIEKNSWCYDYFGNPCDTFGRLYLWDAAKTACPAGWHLPTDKEWTEAEIFYGLKAKDTEIINLRGTHSKKMSDKMKALNIKFGGWKMHEGGYTGLNLLATFWTATEFKPGNDDVFHRIFILNQEAVGRKLTKKTAGFSVRCVKD